MSRHPNEPALSRGDATSIWAFIVAGGVAFLTTTVLGIMRIIELLRNTGVEVPAVFSGTTVEAPIGPNGAPVTVELDRAILIAPELPGASVAAGILEVVVTIVATGLSILFVALLCRELLRGKVFSRKNTRIAAAAGLTAVIGLTLAPFFGNMVANGAFARISDRTFNNTLMAIDLQTLLVSAFIAAFIASVFAVGDRLQRDTEGLV